MMPPNIENNTTAAAHIVAPDDSNSANHTAIPVHAIALKLRDVPLAPATAIITSVQGEFTAPGRHEIVALKAGGVIELYRIVMGADDNDDDEETTRLQRVLSVETRSILRDVVKLRFPGEKRDVISITSDAGALSVLDFENGTAKILHCVDFGKTGCRRSTPGQYLAADPQGRAVVVAAMEKRKLCFVLNRDSQGQSTLASPLEAHRNRTLTVAMVGLDNGFENPMFATLELQYPDFEDLAAGQQVTVDKQLAYYELDLGLNHVSRKWAGKSCLRSACCLVALPGGGEGPGGVLVGGEDWIGYQHDGGSKDDQAIMCALPRRQLHPKRSPVLVTRLALHRQKKSKFFVLAQTELGDVFKVTVELGIDDKTQVTGLQVALLDTLPPANSLNVSKLGMLFCASEFGNHGLYQFERIDLPDAPTNTSDQVETAVQEAKDGGIKVDEAFYTTELAHTLATTFVPTMLQNLRQVVVLENPSPTTGILVGELAGNEVSPQLYTLTGRGPCSALRIMRHGASVTELAVSDLPGVPGGIFTITGEDGDDKYIVVSFADATLVLSVGDSVEEVGKESGFLTNSPTLACSALGHDGAMCQVHPAGIRHIQQGGQALQWNCPGLKRIDCASANTGQVLIALAGGELNYFELDQMNGRLNESDKKDMNVDISCLDIGTIRKGSSRSLFAAVGCRDQTVRIVSLEPGSLLIQRSSTALKARPHSVSLQNASDSGVSNNNELMLVIGLDDGSCLRVAVDPVTGAIGTSPTRRFLGARPVSVARLRLGSSSGSILLSSRPWVSRRDPASGKHVMAPLSYAPLDHGCSFCSEAVRDGIVATAGKTLRILSIDSGAMDSSNSEAFNTNKVELRYTPRQMALMSTPAGDNQRKIVLALVESDCNDYGHEEKARMGFDPSGGANGKTKGKDDDAMDVDSDEEEGKQNVNEGDDEDADNVDARKTPIRGPVPPGPGFWGSCVRLVDPSNSCQTLDCLEMGRKEAALCCASVRFHSKGGEPLLAVGTVTGMTMHPLKQSNSHILLYRVVNGERLQLLHRTLVDDGPVFAVAHFQGRLLVGVGKALRLYEMGKKQLLRKCELKGLPTFVKTLQTVGDRAFVGDMMQSIQVVKYDSSANRLLLVANDSSPRPIVCQELLDWNTVAVGDKFGNVSILRMPPGAESSAVDVTGQRALWDSARDDTTPKLELLCQYYVGEIVTSMKRTSLVAGGSESLIYVTVTGRIGALVPFTSRDDIDFYADLESSLRDKAPRYTGRDPRSFRSYYAPVTHVVDSSLCESFSALPYEEQSAIADKMDRTIGEILKKLEDGRNALL